MVGALSKPTRDILPFTLADGSPARHYRLNTVGLRRAGIHGEAGRHPEALAAAKRATEREPTLEAGWWQLLTQQSAAKEHGAALATLEVLRDKFSAVVDHDSLAGDERYVGLAASDEFAAWSAKQRE